MFDFLASQGFFIQWKNCMTDEDCNGQRMLFSQSADGRKWSPAEVLFPNMTVPGGPMATLEPAPPVHLRGHLYAGASPGFHNSTHDSSAQGSQCCLWPDPLDPRNCGPPNDVAVTYNGTLLLRRVQADGSLGPIFWATHRGAPPAFAAATRVHGIRTLADMDAETQADLLILGPTKVAVPCDPQDGTLKCEACAGGCQIYASIDHDLKIANERSHWTVPGKQNTDVIVYRAGSILWASVRVNSTDQLAWPAIQVCRIVGSHANVLINAIGATSVPSLSWTDCNNLF